MKRLFVVSVLIIALASLFGCNQNDTTDNSAGPEGGGGSQIFLVWAEHFIVHSYSDALAKVSSDSTVTSAYGVILADKLPQFNYAKFNDYSYTHYEVYLGYIGFGDEFNDEDQRPDYGSLSPLNFEGSTSIGSVNGSVNLPDTIVSVQTSVSEQLPKGHSLTVSWNGSNADFYDLSGEYEWLDGNHNWHYVDLDTMISGTSVTFDGSMFQYDGRISIYDISPTNGPLPAIGAQANLSGDGSGFLYFSNRGADIDLRIDVGNGLSWSALAKEPAHNHTKDNAVRLAKIRTMLGL